MSELVGKVGIITGASSGIGKATAVALARKGVKVVLAARRKERLEVVRDQIESQGGSALAVQTEITDSRAVDSLVKRAMEKFGRVDILINSAGIMPLSFMKSTRIAEWDETIDVNLKGVLYGIAAVLPIMLNQKSGHIVNFSSVAGRRIMATGIVYSATKAAIDIISEGLRAELSPSTGIRITVICPGTVVSEIRDGIADEEMKRLISEWKFEFLPAEAIANAILYALSQPMVVSVNDILIRPTGQPR